LRGIPILLVANGETKAAAEALQKELNEDGSDGSCAILEGKGDYPFVQSQAEIAAWLTDVRRNLSRTKVVLELNSDRFKQAFWVQVGTAEPLDSVPKDERPRIVAVADRAANRITVTARNISDFRLLLNDELLDLSKPFTVVVNGEAVKEQRQRSMDFMIQNMQGRFDPTYVFTSYFDGSVPKSDGD
jgi:hypothetical protein